MILDLADEMNVRSMNWVFLLQVLPESSEVSAVSSEGDGDIVDFILETKLNNIVLIVGTNGR